MEQLKKRRSKRRSKAERDELLSKWRASGKTVRQFSAEHGLTLSSMYAWISGQQVLGVENKACGRGMAKSRAKFSEVNVVLPTTNRGTAMTITLRSGHSVTFEGLRVDPAWLASVLKVVNAC